MWGIRNRTSWETDSYAMEREILKLQTQLRNTLLPMMTMSLEVREYAEQTSAEYQVCPHLHDQWAIVRLELNATRLIDQIQEIWNLQEEGPPTYILPTTEIEYLRAKAAHLCFLIIRCNILRTEAIYEKFWRLLYL